MSDDSAPPARPKRRDAQERPRKRRTPPAQEAAAEAAPAAAPDETRPPEVPAFALGWPDDAELRELVQAFEAGNYARVRGEGPALARSTADAAVRRAARELVRRSQPDPVALYMLAAAAMLLVFLAGWYWSHPHHP